MIPLRAYKFTNTNRFIHVLQGANFDTKKTDEDGEYREYGIVNRLKDTNGFIR